MSAAPVIAGWDHVSSGKVRELYVPTGTADIQSASELLLVASDRVSAYDFALEPPIPGKGELLTRLSRFWFTQLSDVPNHIIGDDEMIDRFLARAEGHPEVFLVAPGLGFRWHLTSEDRLRSAVYILNSFGGKILKPPAGAKVDIIAGQPVWVMNPADLAMIPNAA